MTSAKQYWNDYFKEHRDAQMPSQLLIDMLARMQKGRVLDIAMGQGANAVYLAGQGCQVEGFDISDIAIERALSLASESRVQIEARTADLDLYLMKLLHYDSIIMTFFKPSIPRYYSEIIRALKQGGTLLVESSGTAAMDDVIPKDEAYRNFYYSSNELLQNLKELKILFYQEGEVNGKHVMQCLAQKPMDKHSAKYDIFDMKTKNVNIEKSKQIELAEKFFKKK